MLRRSAVIILCSFLTVQLQGFDQHIAQGGVHAVPLMQAPTGMFPMMPVPMQFFFSNTASPTVTVPTTNTVQGSTTATSSPVVTNTQQQSTQVSQTTSVYQQMRNDIAITIKNKIELSQQFLKDHKWSLFGAACFAGYCYLFTKLMNDRYFITSPNSWASWRRRVSTKKLKTMDQKKLAQYLLADIQRKYIGAKDPTNAIMPLIRFLKITETETKRIDSYLRRVYWLSTLRLGLFFPINARLTALARKRKERVALVRELFLSWITTYKMQAIEQAI